MILYSISGLGADERVFSYLKLDLPIKNLDWIDPLKNESLEEYARRLSKGIDTSQPFGLIGVSFGGMMATEISKILNPKFTILLSSLETRNDLRRIWKFIGHSGIARIAPSGWYSPPKSLVSFAFGAKNSKLLHKILDDTDPKFTKWAINAILSWKNYTRLENLIRIQGEKDLFIPLSKDPNTIVIKNGHHFMIVDKSKEISRVINEQIKGLTD